MEFRILGPLEVVVGDETIDVGGPKQRTVLAALLLQANEVVPALSLVETLWGRSSPRTATGMVRSYVSRLRRALASPGHQSARLVRRRPGYVLEVTPSQVDANRFEHLVERARYAVDADEIESAATSLRQALRLWRGEALADLAAVEAFRPSVARLQQMRLVALESRIDAELTLGHHSDVVGDLEALTAQHPFRERFWGQLIVALYRLGRQAEALGAYQRARLALRDHLGLDPGPELQALERQVLSHADELRWHPPAHGDPLGHGQRRPGDVVGDELPVPGRWPVRSTRFFGREAEQAKLQNLIQRARLVTVVGAPGGGKTALAVELVVHLAPSFPAGVWFVDLAPLDDPASVVNAFAAVLGVAAQPGVAMEETIVETLGAAEPGLVLVDNCEHVVSAVAILADHLLARCPSLRLLATSRTAIGLPGESVWELPPLDPTSAADLFVDRATLAWNGFPAVRPSRATVELICTGLDNLPLAIELAVGWTRVLSLDEIASRVASGRALPSAMTDARRPGHRTIEATVGRSYELLAPEVQRTFSRMAVFAGGFDLEAADAVLTTDDEGVVDRLSSLVDHSLVVATPAATGPRRYRLLEPVRQYARGRLADSDEDGTIRARHADHFLALALRHDPWGRRGVRRPVPADRLQADEANLLAALQWASYHRPDVALQLSVALAGFWEVSGRVNDGRRWMDRLLASHVPDPGVGAAAHASAGRLAWRQGDYDVARQHLDQSRALATRHGDLVTESFVLRLLASVALSEGDTSTAPELARQSLALARRSRDRIGEIWSSYVLGIAQYAEGDVASGDEVLWAALVDNGLVGNATVTAHLLLGLQCGAFLARDTTGQRAHLLCALAASEAGGLLDRSEWLWCAASLAAVEERFISALRLVGGADALTRRHGNQHPEPIVAAMTVVFVDATEALGQGLADRCVAQGNEMSWDDLISEATAESDGHTGDIPHQYEIRELTARGLNTFEIARALSVSRNEILMWATRERSRGTAP